MIEQTSTSLPHTTTCLGKHGNFHEDRGSHIRYICHFQPLLYQGWGNVDLQILLDFIYKSFLVSKQSIEVLYKIIPQTSVGRILWTKYNFSNSEYNRCIVAL